MSEKATNSKPFQRLGTDMAPLQAAEVLRKLGIVEFCRAALPPEDGNALRVRRRRRRNPKRMTRFCVSFFLELLSGLEPLTSQLRVSIAMF